MKLGNLIFFSLSLLLTLLIPNNGVVKSSDTTSSLPNLRAGGGDQVSKEGEEG